MVYVQSLFFGTPLLVCAVLGAMRHRWLLVGAGVHGFLATLPEIGGGEIFLAVTGGLVRHPSRFALVGLALLLPMIGRGAEDLLAGKRRWFAACLALGALLACVLEDRPAAWLVAGAPAALMLAGAARRAWRGVRGAALGAGVAAAMVSAWPLLGLQPVDRLEGRTDVWPEIGGGERIYTPAPSVAEMRELARTLDARRVWPVGYLNLADGSTVVRTDAPVAHHRLMDHLRITDQGPHRRWWLDALAARWSVLPD
jgi:hypothetical protein